MMKKIKETKHFDVVYNTTSPRNLVYKVC